MKHSANLDILRTFAVSVVVINHLLGGLSSYCGISVLAFNTELGHVGVLAFFVHTSLVLMYSLERMARSPGRVSVRFYLRRFFRIYPLSILFVTLMLLLHIPPGDGGVFVITPRVVISNYLLVQNIIGKISVMAPLWSLPYEVQMYLVLPALYYLTLKKLAVTWVSCLFVFFCCLGFLISRLSGGHLNMAAYIPCFLCGILCYSLRDRIRACVPAAFWPPALVLMISVYCIATMRVGARFWYGWIFCLVLGLAINAFHGSTQKHINLAAEKIALYSYSVYLINYPVLYIVFDVLGIRNLFFGPLLFLILTIVGSVITYHIIESPFIEIGRKLSSRPVRAPVGVHASGTGEGS